MGWQLISQWIDQDVIQEMEKFFKDIEMPISISELGISLSEEQIQELSHKCTFMGKRTIGSFRVLNEEDIRNIYNAAK